MVMTSFYGKRVLVVEDDYFIAQHLVDWLVENGAEIVGPAPNVGRALSLARANGEIDAAILDINLNGEMVFPVADVLLFRGVPIVFATGYYDRDVPARFDMGPRFSKPVEAGELQEAFMALQLGRTSSAC